MAQYTITIDDARDAILQRETVDTGDNNAALTATTLLHAKLDEVGRRQKDQDANDFRAFADQVPAAKVDEALQVLKDAGATK